ncbi:MAG: AAA family ATPase [Pseudomonadota bacterium]
MYERMYGFDKPPFANIPDPAFLYPSPQHQRAISILQYALMARAGFCVITGDIGAGKTTLVRGVLQNLDMPIEAGLVSNTQCESFEELLRWILLAFDLDYQNKDKVQMYDDFVQYLVQQYQAGRPVTLIIDEAQNLSLELLEQLRMLSNVNTEKGQILQTILVGQPELWDLLRDPAMIQFAQRISYDYFLRPLEDIETVQHYIEHRIATAGSDRQVFHPDCYPLITRATRGVPRLINLLCDSALIYAYGEDLEQVPAKIVERVIEDKQASFAPIVAPAPPEPTKEKRSRATDASSESASKKHKKMSLIEKAAERRLQNKA